MPTVPRPDAEVAAEQLNMRSGPGMQYAVLRSYLRGTALEILGQGPDNDGQPWLFVQAPDGIIGWMSARPSLQETQYIRINISFSEIAFVPTPTATNTPTPTASHTPTPYAAIVLLTPVMITPTSTPTPIPTPIRTPLPSDGGPNTIQSWIMMVDAVSDVVTVLCSRLCQEGQTVTYYSPYQDICLQWHENAGREQVITIEVFLQPDLTQPLKSLTFNGSGTYVCRGARINLNTIGSYRARIEYGSRFHTVDFRRGVR
jgi:hypothetical protein